MRITISEDKKDLGVQAAKLGASKILEAIEEKGYATIVLNQTLLKVIHIFCKLDF